MISTLNGVTAGGGLSLPDFVALAAKNGFTGVEFSIEEAANLVAQNGYESVAGIFEKHKVLPAVFGLPVEWRKDEDTFQSGLAKLSAQAELAQKLGCTRCCTWVLPSGGPEYSENSLRRFIEIARVLNEQGVRFGLEFIGPKHFRTDESSVWFYDIAGALRVVEQVHQAAGTRNVGLLVDCFHWYTSGGTAMDLASIPLEQIVHVHINDAPDVPRDEQQDGVRLLPGESGIIDITAFLQTLNALGYDGPVAVETFSDELRALSAEEAAARAGESVQRVFADANVQPMRLL